MGRTASTRDYLADKGRSEGFISEEYNEETNSSVLKYKSKDGEERYIASSTDSSGSSGTTPVITINGQTPTQELEPNKFYKFGNAVTSLTVTLGTPIDGIVNIYNFSFTAGQANPMNLPDTIIFDETPVIDFGDYVEVSIMDNKGVCKIWPAN